MNRCQSCKETTEEYLVSSIPFAAISIGRCPNCFSNDIYPYDLLVSACWGVGGFDYCAKWFKDIITDNLTFHNKKLKEFKKDMEKVEKIKYF